MEASSLPSSLSLSALVSALIAAASLGARPPAAAVLRVISHEGQRRSRSLEALLTHFAYCDGLCGSPTDSVDSEARMKLSLLVNPCLTLFGRGFVLQTKQHLREFDSGRQLRRRLLPPTSRPRARPRPPPRRRRRPRPDANLSGARKVGSRKEGRWEREPGGRGSGGLNEGSARSLM